MLNFCLNICQKLSSVCLETLFTKKTSVTFSVDNLVVKTDLELSAWTFFRKRI